jgi:hypothetical protein
VNNGKNEVQNVDTKEEEMIQNSIKNKGVGNHVTSARDDGKQKKAHKEKFKVPNRKPTKEEERKMFGKAIELMIKTGMKTTSIDFTIKSEYRNLVDQLV